jgi:hypothetical protein
MSGKGSAADVRAAEAAARKAAEDAQKRAAEARREAERARQSVVRAQTDADRQLKQEAARLKAAKEQLERSLREEEARAARLRAESEARHEAERAAQAKSRERDEAELEEKKRQHKEQLEADLRAAAEAKKGKTRASLLREFASSATATLSRTLPKRRSRQRGGSNASTGSEGGGAAGVGGHEVQSRAGGGSSGGGRGGGGGGGSRSEAKSPRNKDSLLRNNQPTPFASSSSPSASSPSSPPSSSGLEEASIVATTSTLLRKLISAAAPSPTAGGAKSRNPSPWADDKGGTPPAEEPRAGVPVASSSNRPGASAEGFNAGFKAGAIKPVEAKYEVQRVYSPYSPSAAAYSSEAGKAKESGALGSGLDAKAASPKPSLRVEVDKAAIDSSAWKRAPGVVNVPQRRPSGGSAAGDGGGGSQSQSQSHSRGGPATPNADKLGDSGLVLSGGAPLKMTAAAMTARLPPRSATTASAPAPAPAPVPSPVPAPAPVPAPVPPAPAVLNETEKQAQAWMEQVLGLKMNKALPMALSDGVLLCRVVDKLCPGACPKPYEGPVRYRQIENVTAFVVAARKLGVKETDLFPTASLCERGETSQVAVTLLALRRVTSGSATLVRRNSPSNKQRAQPVQQGSLMRTSATGQSAGPALAKKENAPPLASAAAAGKKQPTSSPVQVKDAASRPSSGTGTVGSRPSSGGIAGSPSWLKKDEAGWPKKSDSNSGSRPNSGSGASSNPRTGSPSWAKKEDTGRPLSGSSQSSGSAMRTSSSSIVSSASGGGSKGPIRVEAAKQATLKRAGAPALNGAAQPTLIMRYVSS